MLLILTLLFGFIVFCIFFKKHAGYSKMLTVSFVFLFASGIFLRDRAARKYKGASAVHHLSGGH